MEEKRTRRTKDEIREDTKMALREKIETHLKYIQALESKIKELDQPSDPKPNAALLRQVIKENGISPSDAIQALKSAGLIN